MSKKNRIVICTSAGNNNLEIGVPAPSDDPNGKYSKGDYYYPSSFIDIDNKIVVAAANNDSSYSKASFSNYSKKYCDVTAPGVKIASTVCDNQYAYYDGTSMATPHVAGVATLLKSIYPNKTASEIKAAIKNGANSSYGTSYTINGLLDANGALNYLNGGTTPTDMKITGTLPDGTVGVEYSASLTVTGGTSPHDWYYTGDWPDGIDGKYTDTTLNFSGKPTKAGTYNLVIIAEDAKGNTAEKSFTVTINDSSSGSIQITGTLPNGTVGVEYSGSLTASGGTAPYDWWYTGDWPDGLDGRYNETTLNFSGKPTKAGTYNLVLIAEDANGNTAEKSFTITIVESGSDPNPPSSMQITGTLPNGTVGTSYSATLKVTGGTKPYFISWFDGLPDGLEDDFVDENTGEIKVHGTPTTAGTYKATCTVYDDNLDSLEKTFTITIAAKPTKMTMSGTFKDATVGTTYSGTAKVTGGTAPYTWTKSGTATWIDFKDNKKTGASVTLTGKPTKAGTFTLILNAVDANKSNVKKTFNITVLPKMTLTGTFKGATLGASYSGTAKVTGGTAPYTWAKSGVPTGLTFKSSGANVTLSGKPTKAGTFTLKLTVTDANKVKVSKSFSIVVAAKPAISGTFKGATLGASYSGSAKVTGGTATYTWAKSGVPTGLTFKSSGANVTLSGKPTKAGTFTLKLTVTDANKVKVSKSFSIVVAAKPTISGTFGAGKVGTTYNGSAKVTGGTAPYTWTKSGVPAGLTFKGSGVNATLSSKPTTAKTYSFKLTVKDANGATATKTFSIKIAANTTSAPKISGTFPNGFIYEAYEASIKVSGGSSPYKWTKDSGTLPKGMKLTTTSTGTTLKLKGTPSAAKTYTFKLTVKDAKGASVSKTFKVTINDEIEISSVRTNSTKDFSTEDVVSTYEPATTELKIFEEDVLWQGEDRDEDLFEVKANEPVRFVIGEWKYSNGAKAEVSAEDVEIYVDDKLVEVTVSDEGEFTIPAEFVVDDFKVQAKANDLETFELFISAIE